MPNRKGPKSAAQTPAPKADRVYGSKKNKPNSANSEKSAKSIEFSDKVLNTLKEKADKYNKEHKSKVSLNTLKAVFRRGAGAFSTSHRPNMTRNGWAFARVNKFLEKKSGKPVKKAYIQDDDLMEQGGEINQDIVCVNCGWEWNTNDSDENDKYICHKCGFDNTLYYSSDIMGKQNFDEFADKRLEGAEKITTDSKEKGGLSLLTYYHYNAKLPFYEEATKGGFDLQKAKDEFKKYYSELSYNMEQIEFQDIMGKMEVLGELIIEQENLHSDKLKTAKSLEEISKIHGVELEILEKELEKGIKEEKEHTEDEITARTIALHHLEEKPNYYDILEEAMAQPTIEDEFKDGGVVVGKRHSERDENGTGERFLVESTGQVVELEGGEAVLSKESMQSDDKFSFQGKKMTGREIASILNHKYGGVEFEKGGSVDSVCGCNTKYYHGGELPTATVDSLKGGEAVITVKTMESKDRYNFNNRSLTPRQILSIINEKSGGKKFEEGGILKSTKFNNTKDLTKMVYFTQKVLY